MAYVVNSRPVGETRATVSVSVIEEHWPFVARSVPDKDPLGRSGPVAGAICVILGGTGLAAILMPVWQATKVDPV